jgi:Inner membrane component of T3SS, cytoplasmic domain
MENTAKLNMWAAIQFLYGPLAGSTFQISKPVTVIGQDPGSNDIVVPDQSILRQHARLIWNNGQWYIEKVYQTSVITVNQLNIERVILKDNDVVGLGPTRIFFRFLTQAGAPNTPKPSTDLKYTETTRYLCAAAHLDASFRNYVIKHVVEEEHKAIGESLGVDAVSVARHCLAARRREMFRNIALLLILLILIISRSFALLIPCIILAWVVVFIEIWNAHYRVIANQLTKTKFNPDAINFRLDPNLEQKLRNTANAQNANLVVYSSFTPFVGAGISIGGWSIALNVQKGKQEMGSMLEPLPFQIREMYSHLTNALTKHGVDGLSVKDRLYVDGREIRDDQRFLPYPLARPNLQVDPSLIETFIESPPQSIRHYKCIQVTSWKGELVLSIFLRFSKIGQTLFVEANYFLLPPVKEQYYKIDSIQPSLSIQKIGELLAQSAVTMPLYWLFSPFMLLSAIFRPLQRASEHAAIKRAIGENPSFDYGANSSIRIHASSTEYRRFFQKLDREMYVKIIERQILESIIDFLDRKNIDTTDLKEQRAMILNTGVIVTGGSVTAENIAAGEQARAGFFNIARTATGALGRTQQESAKN